jgi:hypothetical protein
MLEVGYAWDLGLVNSSHSGAALFDCIDGKNLAWNNEKNIRIILSEMVNLQTPFGHFIYWLTVEAVRWSFFCDRLA